MRESKTDIKGRIARVLFNNPQGDLSMYRVAKLAESSYPWAHSLLKRLEVAGMLEATRIHDFKAMMAWWRRCQTNFAYREYTVRDPRALLQEMGLKYALTTYWAENLVQNYLFASRFELYIRGQDMIKWHEAIIRDGLVGGGNVKLMIGDEHVFYKSRNVDGLEIVSVPQLAHDLYNVGAACGEAADMLMEKMEKNAVRKV